MRRYPSYLLTLSMKASPHPVFLKVAPIWQWKMFERGVAVLLTATFILTRVSMIPLILWRLLSSRKLKVTPLVGCRTVRTILMVRGLPFMKMKHLSSPRPRTGSMLGSRLVRTAIKMRLQSLLGVSALTAVIWLIAAWYRV